MSPFFRRSRVHALGFKLLVVRDHMEDSLPRRGRTPSFGTLLCGTVFGRKTGWTQMIPLGPKSMLRSEFGKEAAGPVPAYCTSMSSSRDRWWWRWKPSAFSLIFLVLHRLVDLK